MKKGRASVLHFCCRTSVTLTYVFLLACGVADGVARRNPAPNQQEVHSRTMFADVTREAGIDARNYPPLFDPKISHVNALWANFISAAAVADFDGDGWDDIFIVSSRKGVPNKLYRNNHDWTFTDVAVSAGLADLNDDDDVSVGALWFDFDNDGKPDLLVLRFGRSLLFHNDGNGHFTDVTARSGVALKHMNPLTAVAFDYDNDGKVDILMAGYFADDVDLLNLKTTKFLPNSDHDADNGGSKLLLHNNGDGTFTDVTAHSGLAHTGWTISLAHGDYDNDGWQDVYFANDWGPDKLFHNNRDGTFTDVTAKAIGKDGKHGMNAEFGDYDNDGYLDLFVTNITEPWLFECNMLWHNNHDGTFTNLAFETCDTGWGWGGKFLDFDNDGLLDLYVVNGFISAGRQEYWRDVVRLQASSRDRFDMEDAKDWPAIGSKSFAGYEHKALFRNIGNGSFKEIAAEAGVDNLLDGRGIAIADFDNDGAMDMLVTSSNAAPVLYQNRIGRANNFLELKLVGTRSNHDAIGARVILHVGDKQQIREVNCGNGYAAQSSLRVHFGLGKAEHADRVEIRWPSGIQQVLESVPVNQILVVREVDEVPSMPQSPSGRRN
jgi:hypothetical protein